MSFRHLLPPLPTTPAERFSTMINMLLQAITGRTGAGGLDFWMVQAISRRVIRLSVEIRDLVAALRAGTLRTRRSPAAGLTRRPASVRRPDGTMLLLPRRFGWLLPLVPIGAPMAGHHYRELLAEPELAALLAASPRLLRSVRSLGWMLGVKVPGPTPPAPPDGPGEASGGETGEVPPVRSRRPKPSLRRTPKWREIGMTTGMRCRNSA